MLPPLMVKTQLLICTLNPLCCAAQSEQTANEQNSIGKRDYVGTMELKVQLKAGAKKCHIYCQGF